MYGCLACFKVGGCGWLYIRTVVCVLSPYLSTPLASPHSRGQKTGTHRPHHTILPHFIGFPIILDTKLSICNTRHLLPCCSFPTHLLADSSSHATSLRLPFLIKTSLQTYLIDLVCLFGPDRQPLLTHFLSPLSPSRHTNTHPKATLPCFAFHSLALGKPSLRTPSEDASTSSPLL